MPFPKKSSKRKFRQPGATFVPREKTPPKNPLLTGIYSKGGQNFGFVQPSKSPDSDAVPEKLFVHGSKAGDALDGDSVEFKAFLGKYGKTEARIESVTERSSNLHFGLYHKQGNSAVVKLFDGPHVRILNGSSGQIASLDTKPANGETVGIQVTGFGRAIGGKIIVVLGSPNAPGYYQKLALLESGAPTEFPANVRDIARSIHTPKLEDHSHRLDLRESTIITIDGPDAKDLDDAIEVIRTPDGYTLWVHIADVTAYVKAGSEIDREAVKRGTSIYMADRVIPMLPGELSNHLCSLHPGSPKLCFSLRMDLDMDGQAVKSELFETVIQSQYRSTYQEVENYRTGKETAFPESVNGMLKHAWALKDILTRRRKNEGKIEFVSPDFQLVLDKGKIQKIIQKPHLEAEELIEEFMVLANEEVAKIASRKQLPFLYRVHERPTEIGISRLREILTPMGIDFRPRNEEKPSPKELQYVVDQVHKKDPEGWVTRSILSCMTKAVYSEKSMGHFGLALEHYSHFTSPIRRYPDLQIHRILKYSLDGELPRGLVQSLTRELPLVARQCSMLERRAERLEYTIRDIFVCEWLTPQIGEVFEGRVTTILENGYFVQVLPAVEGFVLFGKNRVSMVELGDVGNYELVSVDMATRKVDLRRV
jgi:ribonuclease R